MLKDGWKNCKNILCIRPDNMGDLLMSVPAIRALKQSTGAKITVLTSSMAAGVAGMIPEIDEVMAFDLPWVKTRDTIPADSFNKVVAKIRLANFDAAVIFTVYSQNPLPTVMLAYLAGIPLRLAYCRENPYELLTSWVPDTEPYTEIKHQVRRDLHLVAQIGAFTTDEKIAVNIHEGCRPALENRLSSRGINLSKPWLIFHPGVSEMKREYPKELWIETGILLAQSYQLLITGTASEKPLADQLREEIGENAFSMAGLLSLDEFVLLIKSASLVISVNTGTVHLAAATQTPVIVLYALTNPQHYPWKVPGRVFTFKVAEELRSRNEVIRFVNEKYFSSSSSSMVMPYQLAEAAKEILSGNCKMIPELEL